jgi:flagellar motor switch protein FliM
MNEETTQNEETTPVEEKTTGKASSSVQAYDFESQERTVRGRIPTLELINERFARNMRVTLFNFFRHTVNFTVKKNQVLKFNEYTKTLKIPTSINIIKMYPIAATMLFIFDSELVFSIVESFFGGDGRFDKKTDARDFTPTETRIVQRIIELAFVDLKEAWKGLMEVEFEYQATEVNPSMATMVSPTDVVIVSEFGIEVEAGGGSFYLAIPYSMLEPLKEVLDSKIHSEHGKSTDERWEKALQAEILDVKVDVSSKLTEVNMSMKDLIDLQAGNIIPFEMPSILTVCVQGIPTFHATYGNFNDHAALRIVETIQRPKEYK